MIGSTEMVWVGLLMVALSLFLSLVKFASGPMSKIESISCLVRQLGDDLKELERWAASSGHQRRVLLRPNIEEGGGANKTHLTAAQELRTTEEHGLEAWCNGGKRGCPRTIEKCRPMDESEFEAWCMRGLSKLERYKVAEMIEFWSILLFFLILFLVPFMLNRMVQAFFMVSVDIAILLLGAILIATMSLLALLRLARYPMNRIEYLSCLLAKIATDIKDRDRINLESDLRQLKKHSTFPLKFPERRLFVTDITKQEEFYELLKQLHKRLFYKLKMGSLEDVNHEDIKKLGYYIHEDREEKLAILKKIIDENPEELPPPIMPLVREIVAHLYSKAVFVTLLLFFFSYLVLFRYIGLEMNTIAIVFTLVWIFLIGILYVQKVLKEG